MKNIKLTYDNGNTIITDINGTAREIKEYYMKNPLHNIGNGEHDLFAKLVNLEFFWDTKYRHICDHCNADIADNDCTYDNQHLCYSCFNLKVRGI